MDTRRAGAMGGIVTKQRYGIEHFRAIQLKGAKIRKQNNAKKKKAEKLAKISEEIIHS